MNYLICTLLILNSILGAWCAKLSNNNVPYAGWYVYIVGSIGILLWVWASRISKNLLFDSMLYDIILTIMFTGTLIILKCGSSFTMYNWIGVVLALIGLILIKI